MAKSRSFFGLRRGSTKSLTFSVLDGKQITKDRVYGGKNPRTQAQMVQRMVMATASAAYAHMKEIVDHSFEGVTYGAPTMARFVSENAKAIKEAYDAGQENFGYNGYQNRELMIGKYIMSKGQAPRLDAGTRATNAFQVDLGGGTCSVVTFINGGGTANNYLAKMGLQVGEIATACFLYPKAGSSVAWGFAFIRITSLKGGTVELTADNFDDYFLIESNFPVTANFGAGNLSASISPADAELSLATGAYCVIHSVKSNGVWTRSNESMVFKGSPDVQLSAEDGLATYPVGQSYVLNGGEIE